MNAEYKVITPLPVRPDYQKKYCNMGLLLLKFTSLSFVHLAQTQLPFIQ